VYIQATQNKTLGRKHTDAVVEELHGVEYNTASQIHGQHTGGLDLGFP
jgi:hypothetical protein